MPGEQGLRLANQFLSDVGASERWMATVAEGWPQIAPVGEVRADVVVELRRLTDGVVGFGVLTGAAPTDAAQTEFVSQLQDIVLENSGGAALPPCPGHRHPQDPQVMAGVLTWRCPSSSGHLRRR